MDVLETLQEIRKEKKGCWTLPLAGDLAGEVLSQLLSEQEQTLLKVRGELFAEKSLGPSRLTISVFQNQFHTSAEIRFFEKEAMDNTWWELPEVLQRQSLRPGNLSLVVGPQGSGKSSALASLIQRGFDQHQFAIFSDDGIWDGWIPGARAQIFAENQFEMHRRFNSFSVIVLDSLNPNHLHTALSMAEWGKSVLVTMPAFRFEEAWSRFADYLIGEPSRRWHRLSQHLGLSLGVRVMPGREAPWVSAFESLSFDQTARERLAQGDVAALTTLQDAGSRASVAPVNQGTEPSMRTLNQGLLSLILRRKIDLKVGFETSHDPVALEEMLKKVGY